MQVKKTHAVWIATLGCLALVHCSAQSSATEPPAPDPAPVRFLALGDSYTIGEGVAPGGRWPEQLAAALRQRDYRIDGPTIVARTGWTTGELMSAIDRAALAGEYGLVSLLIGVNNQYRGQSLDAYRLEFEELLERAIAFAGGDPERVVVLSIPDWGVTPFAAGRDRERIAAEIDALNAANREATALAGAHYVDVTPLSREAAQNATWLAADGLHPSRDMYTAWVQLALPTVLSALQAPR